MNSVDVVREGRWGRGNDNYRCLAIGFVTTVSGSTSRLRRHNDPAD